MATLTPQYSSNRAVREYTEKYYLPAALGYRKRAENSGALAKKIIEWRRLVNEHWNALKFDSVKIEKKADQTHFEVNVYLDGLDPKSVKLQLYSVGKIIDMDHKQELPNAISTHAYTASLPLSDNPSNFTPRLIPTFEEVAVPLEVAQILWQK